jgi:hypothetical protein
MAEDKKANTEASKRSGPFALHCHATLGELDLVKINRSFRSLALARAVAATLVVSLSPKSAKLIKGGTWTITEQVSGRVHSGHVAKRQFQQ